MNQEERKVKREYMRFYRSLPKWILYKKEHRAFMKRKWSILLLEGKCTLEEIPAWYQVRKNILEGNAEMRALKLRELKEQN